MLTRSQTDLGVDATLRWALLGSFAHRAIAGDSRGNSHTATVLGASVAGTAAGLAVGRGLTDGEAGAMVAGSNYTLAIGAGTMAALGAFDDRCRQVQVTEYAWNPVTMTYDQQLVTRDRCSTHTSQAEWGTLLAAGVVGYPLGLAYARRNAYTVTAGDMSALMVPAGLGLLAGLTAAGDDADDKTTWGAMTGGLVLGLVAGDRLLVKPFDYTRSQATAIRVGAVAGGLLGMALPAASEADDGRVYAATALVGAGLGAALAHGMVGPRRAQDREVLREARVPGSQDLEPLAAQGNAPRVQWQLDPVGFAMAAARAPGRHGLLSLTF
jgi:hypothetical protein